MPARHVNGTATAPQFRTFDTSNCQPVHDPNRNVSDFLRSFSSHNNNDLCTPLFDVSLALFAYVLFAVLLAANNGIMRINRLGDINGPRNLSDVFSASHNIFC